VEVFAKKKVPRLKTSPLSETGGIGGRDMGFMDGTCFCNGYPTIAGVKETDILSVLAYLELIYEVASLGEIDLNTCRQFIKDEASKGIVILSRYDKHKKQ